MGKIICRWECAQITREISAALGLWPCMLRTISHRLMLGSVYTKVNHGGICYDVVGQYNNGCLRIGLYK